MRSSDSLTVQIAGQSPNKTLNFSIKSWEKEVWCRWLVSYYLRYGKKFVAAVNPKHHQFPSEWDDLATVAITMAGDFMSPAFPFRF